MLRNRLLRRNNCLFMKNKQLQEKPGRPKVLYRVLFFQRGFTLLELLVVIFIVGIITTFATMSVSTNSNRIVEQEAKRLAALVELAAEEAILNSRDMVLLPMKSAYQFVSIDVRGRLSPFDDESGIFRPRQLPTGITLRLELDGDEIALSDEEDQQNQPRIYMFSSGEMTPFLFEVQLDENKGLYVNGEYTGEVEYRGQLKDGFD